MNSSTETADGWTRSSTRESAKTLDRTHLLLLVYVALCGLSLVPFLAVAEPPIVDFANHAARLTMACHMQDPAIAAMYRYRLGVIPNLAVDLVNLPLCGVVSASAILRLVTGCSLLLIYFSGWLTQRHLFGRANAFLLLLPAIAFNLVTTMGYINFLAGVAVACLMIALALPRERRFWALLLIGNVGGLVVFFCHIFALAFAMLILFGLMLRQHPLSWKAFFGAGVRTAFVFGLPLCLIAVVPSASGPAHFGYLHKVRMVPALFMAQHTSVGLYGLALIAAIYVLIKKKSVQIADQLRLPLAILGLFALAIPCSIRDAVDVDSRLLVALAYLFFASLKPTENERELTIGLAALASALVAFELWLAVTIWQPFSREVDELRTASAVLPANAKVLTIANSEGPQLIAASLAYSHVTSYVTIERHIFNPLEFTGVGMQPLSVTPAFAAVDSPTGQPYSPELANRFIRPDTSLATVARENEAGFALGWPRKFDYVIFYHFGGRPNFNPALLQEMRRGSFFSILKVKKALASKEAETAPNSARL